MLIKIQTKRALLPAALENFCYHYHFDINREMSLCGIVCLIIAQDLARNVKLMMVFKLIKMNIATTCQGIALYFPQESVHKFNKELQ